MRVFKKDGKWFSMDNRRLWVFKKLEAEGHIKDVTVRQMSAPFAIFLKDSHPGNFLNYIWMFNTYVES
jgi:hypothetical protein